MNRCASAGLTVAGTGTCFADASSFRRALASASGSRDRIAPDSSAWYSRERLTAIWMIAAAVGDVRELVGQDAAKLTFVEDLQDALCHRDGGVVGVPPGGERVRLHHVRDVDAGHRHPIRLRELSDDPVELRRLLLRDGLGPRRRDSDLVAEPVHREVEDKRDGEGDDGSLRPAEHAPDDDEQATQGRDQDPGLYSVQADQLDLTLLRTLPTYARTSARRRRSVGTCMFSQVVRHTALV